MATSAWGRGAGGHGRANVHQPQRWGVCIPCSPFWWQASVNWTGVRISSTSTRIWTAAKAVHGVSATTQTAATAIPTTTASSTTTGSTAAAVSATTISATAVSTSSTTTTASSEQVYLEADCSTTSSDPWAWTCPCCWTWPKCGGPQARYGCPEAAAARNEGARLWGLRFAD